MFEYIQNNRRIITSSLMAAFLYFAASIFDPYVTVYLLGKGFDKEAISFVWSMAPLSLIVFPPILGKLSDVLGRRRVIGIGIILFFISQIMYLYVGHSYLLLIMATILVYVGFESVVESLLSRTEDGASKHRGLITGLFESTKQVGYLAGIAFGAFLVTKGGIELNIKYAAFILVILFIFNNVRPNHNHNKPCLNDFNPINDIKDFLRIPELRPMAILGFTMNFTSSTRTILVPVIVLEVLKIDIKYIGLYLATISAGHLFQFVFGYLCEKYSHIKIINISNLLTALGLLLIGLARSPIELLAAGIITGLALAAWNTSAWTHMSEIGEKYKEEGTVVGSYTSIASLGSFSGYLLVGSLIATNSPRIILFIFSGVAVVGVLIANIYFKKYSHIK